jgi:FkbM family methyltransferase
MTALDRARSLAPRRFKAALFSIATGPAADRLVRFLSGRTVRHHGMRIAIDETSPGTAAKLFLGLYERAEIALIRRFLDPGSDVIELGGSIGAGTCQIARRLQGRRMICVEASPVLAERIRANLALNRLDNVTVVAKAIDYGGADHVHFAADHDLGGRVGDRGIRVPTTTLADLVREHGVTDYTLVADIEGAEVPLFIRDEEGLRTCRSILIEMDGGDYRGRIYRADDVERLILDRGFERIYRHGPVAAFRRADQLTADPRAQARRPRK